MKKLFLGRTARYLGIFMILMAFSLSLTFRGFARERIRKTELSTLYIRCKTFVELNLR